VASNPESRDRGASFRVGDPDVIAATMAAPGVVLKRPVGSGGPFAEHVELPADLGGDDSSKRPHRKPARRKPPKHTKRRADQVADRKAVLAFEREQTRRERERAKEEAARQRKRERRLAAVDKAQSTLEAARQKHEGIVADIQSEAEALEKRSQAEEVRWAKERARLEDALRRARA
jgi:hypothetical protein